MSFCRLLFFFSKITFRKFAFRNTIRMSNNLDPDQARRIVGPDLGPNCLQRFSADGTGRQRVKIAEWRERVTHTLRFSHYDKMISFYCKNTNCH